jgi:hypothetical protein
MSEYFKCCSLKIENNNNNNNNNDYNNNNNNRINKQICCTSNKYGLIFYANNSDLIILSTIDVEKNKNLNDEICKINFDTNIIQINISSSSEYIGIVRCNNKDSALYIVETYDLNKLIEKSLFEKNCINSINVKKDSYNLTCSWSKNHGNDKLLVLDKDNLTLLSPKDDQVIILDGKYNGFKSAAAWHCAELVIIYCIKTTIYIYDILKDKFIIEEDGYPLPSCTKEEEDYIFHIDWFSPEAVMVGFVNNYDVLINMLQVDGVTDQCIGSSITEIDEEFIIDEFPFHSSENSKDIRFISNYNDKWNLMTISCNQSKRIWSVVYVDGTHMVNNFSTDDPRTRLSIDAIAIGMSISYNSSIQLPGIDGSEMPLLPLVISVSDTNQLSLDYVYLQGVDEDENGLIYEPPTKYAVPVQVSSTSPSPIPILITPSITSTTPPNISKTFVDYESISSDESSVDEISVDDQSNELPPSITPSIVVPLESSIDMIKSPVISPYNSQVRRELTSRENIKFNFNLKIKKAMPPLLKEINIVERKKTKVITGMICHFLFYLFNIYLIIYYYYLLFYRYSSL